MAAEAHRICHALFDGGLGGFGLEAACGEDLALENITLRPRA
jgi:hypothetical protein